MVNIVSREVPRPKLEGAQAPRVFFHKISREGRGGYARLCAMGLRYHLSYSIPD